jgi:hypothetical protein
VARGTPLTRSKRAGGRPDTGGVPYPSEVLARNVKVFRAARDMKQADLAALMSELGHEWSDGIVGFVEQNARTVHVDELVGLALVFGVHFGQLLDPLGIDGRRADGLFVGLEGKAIPPREAHDFVHGFRRIEYKVDGTTPTLAYESLPEDQARGRNDVRPGPRSVEHEVDAMLAKVATSAAAPTADREANARRAWATDAVPTDTGGET